MKSVLITGATSGIGKATALKFAAEGYFVLCHGKDENSDFSVISEIEKNGGLAKKVFADFSKEKEIRTMFEGIDHIDVLINNAGTVTRTKPITTENFRKTLEINLIAPYLCAELAKEKGVMSIVNTGSMRALLHQATTPDYSASKAAIHNLTVSLAKSYAPNIRVNAVAPGFTKTNMHEGMDDRLEQEREKTPLNITGNPADVAEAIYFLASEKARFITGEILVVDGGRNFGG